MSTLIALHHTWSWPGRDLMMTAVQDGVAAGLAATAERARKNPRLGEVVAAELYGKTTEVLESVRVGADECVHGWELALAEKGQITERRARAVGPVPWLRVTVRGADGRDADRDVCVDPAALGAETPEEAAEYVENLVASTLGTHVPRDPERLPSGWLKCGELGEALGFDAAMERARSDDGPDPFYSTEQLEMRAKMIYGDYAMAHERTGAPSAVEIAEQLHLLSRDARAVPETLVEIVSRAVPRDQIRRLERLLDRAYDVEVSKLALGRDAALPEIVVE